MIVKKSGNDLSSEFFLFDYQLVSFFWLEDPKAKKVFMKARKAFKKLENATEDHKRVIESQFAIQGDGFVQKKALKKQPRLIEVGEICSLSKGPMTQMKLINT